MKVKKLQRIEELGFRVAKYLPIDLKDEVDIDDIIELLTHSKEGSVNIRTWRKDREKGSEFIYGLTSVDEIVSKLNKLRSEGYEILLNETIDKDDGGISGVMLGNIVEFAPFSTPRNVENGNVCRLPIDIAIRILAYTYNLSVTTFNKLMNLSKISKEGHRIEFSVHPKHPQYTVWEIDTLEGRQSPKFINVPQDCDFSKMIGNKTFGLLLMSAMNINVPNSEVINMYLDEKFKFGLYENKQSDYKWLRPAPKIKEPGKYDSIRSKKLDIPKRIREWDKEISSYIIQDDVNSEYSGSAIMRENWRVIVEGVEGTGEDFMVGKKEVESLPKSIIDKVIRTLLELRLDFEKNGIINTTFSIEWGIVDRTVIIFQFNFIEDDSNEDWIVEPKNGDTTYIDYNVERGLEEFRDLTSKIKEGQGINLIGNIGITSHFGDLLRKYRIPSRIINRID